VREIEKRKGVPLTAVERRHLEQRLRTARHWLDHYAADEDKFALQETLPARAAELTAAQRAFLHLLAAELKQTPWNEDALQARIFAVARATPIGQPLAFQAIYRVLLDRNAGPKAGNLLAFLDADFVRNRFLELPVSEADWWRETAVSEEMLDEWMRSHSGRVISAAAMVRRAANDGVAALDVAVTLDDEKTYVHRVLLGDADVHARAAEVLDHLRTAHHLRVDSRGSGAGRQESDSGT